MSIVMVLSAMATAGLGGLTDPAFIASLATLVTALTGLIIAVRAQGAVTRTQEHVAITAAAVEANGHTLEDVKQQTNGTVTQLRAKIYILEQQLEAAGGATGSTGPPSPLPSGGASGTTGSSSGQ